MENLDTLLDSRDLLTRIHPFQLNREDGRVFIYIYEVLAGTPTGQYVAEPTLLVGTTKDEFLGRGASVEEALKDCLGKIKGRATKEIAGLPRE